MYCRSWREDQSLVTGRKQFYGILKVAAVERDERSIRIDFEVVVEVRIDR